MATEANGKRKHLRLRKNRTPSIHPGGNMYARRDSELLQQRRVASSAASLKVNVLFVPVIT